MLFSFFLLRSRGPSCHSPDVSVPSHSGFPPPMGKWLAFLRLFFLHRRVVHDLLRHRPERFISLSCRLRQRLPFFMFRGKIQRIPVFRVSGSRPCLRVETPASVPVSAASPSASVQASRSFPGCFPQPSLKPMHRSCQSYKTALPGNPSSPAQGVGVLSSPPASYSSLPLPASARGKTALGPRVQHFTAALHHVLRPVHTIPSSRTLPRDSILYAVNGRILILFRTGRRGADIKFPWNRDSGKQAVPPADNASEGIPVRFLIRTRKCTPVSPPARFSIQGIPVRGRNFPDSGPRAAPFSLEKNGAVFAGPQQAAPCLCFSCTRNPAPSFPCRSPFHSRRRQGLRCPAPG